MLLLSAKDEARARAERSSIPSLRSKIHCVLVTESYDIMPFAMIRKGDNALGRVKAQGLSLAGGLCIHLRETK